LYPAVVEPLDRLFQVAADDRTRGAAEIERDLLAGLLDNRRLWTDERLKRGATRLTAGQPSMANLRGLARVLAGLGPVAAGPLLRRRLNLLDELPARLGAAGWPHVEGCLRVVTLSRSSAVRAVLEWAWQAGWKGETVVLDGGPAGGGADHAALLADRGGRVLSQPDATAPRWLDGDGVRVLVGADAVSRRRFVNACGTRALLELAAARPVPRVLVADRGKDLPDEELDELLAENRSASETGVGWKWPVFEAIPFSLVDLRVDEGM
jgi:translation initiation factor 2B subunit (eIF-2B alpha/beta/delta family)